MGSVAEPNGRSLTPPRDDMNTPVGPRSILSASQMSAPVELIANRDARFCASAPELPIAENIEETAATVLSVPDTASVPEADEAVPAPPPQEATEEAIKVPKMTFRIAVLFIQNPSLAAFTPLKINYIKTNILKS